MGVNLVKLALKALHGVKMGIFLINFFDDTK
jgi:hypothetical protein